jgi:hypothetical protein
MQRFNIVVPLQDGGVAVHPMKEWLRRNPEHIPAGMNPNSNTSHQLRAALKRRGWQIEETPDEVRLMMPGSPADGATVTAVLGAPEEATTASEAEATSFALEAQLRDFIAGNLPRIPINNVALRVFTDSTGRTGIEYPTGVGPIDILAVDSSGNLYVFELKLDRGPDRALGQLARYMGWVKLHLADAHSVNGVVVARAIDERLRYAAAVIPNVVLLEYEVEFSVRQIGAHGSETPIAG